MSKITNGELISTKEISHELDEELFAEILQDTNDACQRVDSEGHTALLGCYQCQGELFEIVRSAPALLFVCAQCRGPLMAVTDKTTSRVAGLEHPTERPNGVH